MPLSWALFVGDFQRTAKGVVLVVPLSAALFRIKKLRACDFALTRLGPPLSSGISGNPGRLTTRAKRSDIGVVVVLISPFAPLKSWC
jgi:hypothetical protein